MTFFEPHQFLERLNQIYDELKLRVITALPMADVDHIGSSAINGAISKGDLDILVRVDESQFEASLSAIISLGFQIKPETLRTPSLCMLTTNEFNDDVAIQLIARGSEFEDFLKFRDRLNDHPQWVDDYNQLKLNSVGLDADAYRAKKSVFIECVLSRSE